MNQKIAMLVGILGKSATSNLTLEGKNMAHYHPCSVSVKMTTAIGNLLSEA